MSESCQSQLTPIVWSIGGVDPTALAGISADNRAIAVSDAHGVNIVTCVMAQNSNAFFSQQETAIELLEQQWLALSQQCLPAVIKVGILASTSQINWLSGKLQQIKRGENAPWIIYDPVLRASSDAAPVFRHMLSAINEQLMPLVDLLTPNIPEAVALSGTSPERLLSLLDYTKSLSEKFNCQVLLKGGHVSEILGAENESSFSDFYARASHLKSTRYRPEPCHAFSVTQPATQTANRRGSGCILASLIAGFVANKYTCSDAIVLSSGVMQKAYRSAKALGLSRGGALCLTPNIEYSDLPHIRYFNDTDFERVANYESAFSPCPQHLGLYPVVDSIAWLERLLKQGVRTIELRAKDQKDSAVEPLVKQAVKLGREYGMRVFINDYWQLAIKYGAFGVHLGQEDMAIADLTAINRAGLRLGLSTHGLLEAQWASQFSPSYMAIGHIFATQTKNMPSRPQGINKFKTQVSLFTSKLPLVAIGGISAERIPLVVKSGVGSVAVVTAITQASDQSV